MGDEDSFGHLSFCSEQSSGRVLRFRAVKYHVRRVAAFELVIFDCDGVLVDSEQIANDVFVEQMAELGLRLDTRQAFTEFVGTSWAHCSRVVEQRLGRPLPSTFLQEHFDRCRGRMERELLPVPGVAAVVTGLDCLKCVASNGEIAKMRMTLGITGLLPLFEGALFSATEVAAGKPDPDVFLWAARTMGVDPGRVAVVEDTVAGVTAGVRAGMTVFGYTATMGHDRLAAAGAHVLINDMSQLLRLLASHPIVGTGVTLPS